MVFTIKLNQLVAILECRCSNIYKLGIIVYLFQITATFKRMALYDSHILQIHQSNINIPTKSIRYNLKGAGISSSDADLCEHILGETILIRKPGHEEHIVQLGIQHQAAIGSICAYQIDIKLRIDLVPLTIFIVGDLPLDRPTIAFPEYTINCLRT